MGPLAARVPFYIDILTLMHADFVPMSALDDQVPLGWVGGCIRELN